MTLQDVLALPPTLTADEVAPILRVSRGAVYDALRAGTIPSIRVGRRILVPTAEFARVVLGLDVTFRGTERGAHANTEFAEVAQ